ncbi:hypothetical protein I3760_04G188100 [Carya illinoinensis]|nr:hypothetical protein I3760_04G188100 [Carya illinoinensis]
MKQNSSAGSAVTLLNFKRRALLDCNRGSSLLWQSVWKCKSLWKQNFGWQRSKAKYSYDLRSYTLNFDDGFFNDSFSYHGSH